MNNYRELVWLISREPSSIRQRPFGTRLWISVLEKENELFRLDPERRDVHGLRLLATRLARSDFFRYWWRDYPLESPIAMYLGYALWAWLPQPIRQTLEVPERDESPLYLKIATPIGDIADIPWEMISDGSQHFALRPNIHLVRSVPARFAIPSLSVNLPLRLLLVLSDPTEAQPLEALTEINAITEGLNRTEYEVRVIDARSIDFVAKTLDDWTPHIFHYIGQGGLTYGEGNIILQTHEGRARWVTATELARLLPSSVRLLCLSTPCTTSNYDVRGLSRLGQSPRNIDLPTTVANQAPVMPRTATAFWQAFYSSLTARAGSVLEAMHAARLTAATLEGRNADWTSYSVTVRDQNGKPFSIRPADNDSRELRSLELSAQFAAKLANDLALQRSVLRPHVPKSLEEQYKDVHGILEDLLHRISAKKAE